MKKLIYLVKTVTLLILAIVLCYGYVINPSSLIYALVISSIALIITLGVFTYVELFDKKHGKGKGK